jgi:hypothetical protein
LNGLITASIFFMRVQLPDRPGLLLWLPGSLMDGTAAP